MLDALLSWDGWTVTQLPAEQAAIFRLEGVPPSEEFLFIQESEALEILFCRKGELFEQRCDGVFRGAAAWDEFDRFLFHESFLLFLF